MIDNYCELRNRVQDFGDLYFNNTGKELLDEMEEYIYGESDKFEKDIMENVLQSESYSEKIKKEAEELLESANMEKQIATTDLQKEIEKVLSIDDTFIQDEGLESRWKLVKTKTVLDDGLLTDYSWYKDNEGHHIMILGDTDLYTPDNSSADWESDNEAEAKEWFANYEGSESEEDPLADYTNELWGYYDNTPSGILNIYDSIADSDVNDVFVQDDIEDPNNSENKMKAALEYVVSVIDDNAKIENDHIVQTITLYNDDFRFDSDYSEIDIDYYKVSDSTIIAEIGDYVDTIAGEYQDNETGLGFDFEVYYNYDYDNDTYVSIEYHLGSSWEPLYQDRDEGGSVKINIYYCVKIK